MSSAFAASLFYSLQLFRVGLAAELAARQAVQPAALAAGKSAELGAEHASSVALAAIQNACPLARLFWPGLHPGHENR